MSDMQETLTAGDVVAAYRLLLGRHPESDSSIQHFLALGTLDRVREGIVSSAEYAERILRDPALCPPLQAAFERSRVDRLAARRMEHLEHLGLEWCGRDALCYGIGSSIVPSFFLDRLGRVLWADPRAEAVEAGRRAMAEFVDSGRAANLRVGQVDIDRNDVSCPLVVCYDATFNPGNLGPGLERLCAAAGEMIVLDLEIVLRDDPTVQLTRFAKDGEALLPTRGWLLRELGRLMPHVYIPAAQPRDAIYPVEADTDHSGRTANCVVIASRTPLSSSALRRFGG